LGEKSGVDLVAEAAGALPEPDEKALEAGRPWLLGDTYNVSIGQGELLVTPLGLLNYIAAIGNGGKLNRPYVNRTLGPQTRADLSALRPSFAEVEEGMRAAVSSPEGTARLLADLPFRVAAKTGTAQIDFNRKENAFFVGYGPVAAPQKKSAPKIAVLVLVEESREGSLNAVPIAKDVLEWYYWNRIAR
jgi:penicillin-binding protein 2